MHYIKRDIFPLSFYSHILNHPHSQLPEGGGYPSLSMSRPPLPPTLSIDRPPPPSGYTHPATVSDGITTERLFPDAKPEGGWVPLSQHDRGVPLPHSNKRGGGPLPPTLSKDRLPPPLRVHVHGYGLAWSHDGEGILRAVVFKGGWVPLRAHEGYPPPPPLKNKRGGPPHQSYARQGTHPPSQSCPAPGTSRNRLCTGKVRRK